MSNEKTLKKHSIKDDFSMMAILTIPVCVAVNFVGGQLASLLKLPMYLDVIGTIFSGIPMRWAPFRMISLAECKPLRHG